MNKLTKIIAPALVALLGGASLAPAVAEAAPYHHAQSAHARSSHHAPPRYVKHHRPAQHHTWRNDRRHHDNGHHRSRYDRHHR
ncbi:hypothetical protein [Novosphingobium resinovorum]|uniref:hypothetical protein n=1 Tax=Novosphingobium resinovorum TaxID=158500 RepID=UPI002ECFCE68|nr:hypothetical protein [Novosphingobium resinovorum]